MNVTWRFRLTIAGIVALGIVPAFVVRAEPPRQQRATAEFFQRLDKNRDGSRIGVWGSSAGGHLVAMLGTSGGVKELEGDLGKHTDQDSRVTCVVDYFGPSDLLSMGKYPSRMDHNSADSPESRLVGGPVQETKDAARSAAPTSYVSKDDPPFLIAHGTEDPLVPLNQSERLDASLRKAGVDVLLVKMVGAGHGFRNEEITRRVHAFFEKHLRGKDVGISGEPIE